MTTSTIPTVKAALVNGGGTGLLQAAAGLAGVEIVYGPDTRDVERDTVFVGDSVASDQEFAAIGAQSRSEDYSIEIVITSTKPGASQQEATERAFALLAAIETALRTSPTLGVTIATGGVRALTAEVRQPSHEEYSNGEGRACTVTTLIHITTRI